MLLLAVFLLAIQAEPSQPETPRAEAEHLFTLGNTLISERDVRGAIAAYEGALATGWTSPELELNLGSAYFESGQLGRAVLHAERAHRLAPQHEAVSATLYHFREHIGTSAPPRPPDEATARWLSIHVGAARVTAMLLVLWIAVLGLIGFRVGTGEARPWLRRALVVLVPLAVFVAAGAFLAARYEATPRVVALADTIARATYSSTASTVDEVPEGVVLSSAEQRGRWRAVRLPSGDVGWIESAVLEEI